MHFSVGFISLRFEKFRLARVGRIDFEINVDTILLTISGVSRNISVDRFYKCHKFDSDYLLLRSLNLISNLIN